MTEQTPQINPWFVALAVMFGTFMEVLDTTVVNVSLPHIAGSLSVTSEEATWALTSYLVANAIVLPITGWLATYFGRKRLLMSAVVGFTASSFMCGFAPNLAWLGDLSNHARLDGGRATAGFAGSHARSISARTARQSDGFLGLRHRRRANAGSRSWRLADG
jgi:MFS family permease